MEEHQADLHIHTTASDGVLAPSQVVFRARERGLTCLAISDHDTVAGIVEAQRAAAQAEITLIPAVELSTGGEQEIHILGYGVPLNDVRLEAFLSRMAQERMDRAERMLAKLSALGMPLDKNEIPVKNGGVIGRPQIARAMIARGYAASVHLSVILAKGAQPMCREKCWIHPRQSRFCAACAQCRCWRIPAYLFGRTMCWRRHCRHGAKPGFWAWRYTTLPICLINLTNGRTAPSGIIYLSPAAAIFMPKGISMRIWARCAPIGLRCMQMCSAYWIRLKH